MNKTMTGLLVCVALGLGCSGQVGQPERSQLGDAAADSQTMKEATAAAEEVVRAAGDCDAVKAAAPEALRKLDEIKSRVRTGAGQTAIDSLRKQVTDTAGACP
jgi:hypothetical protein